MGLNSTGVAGIHRQNCKSTIVCATRSSQQASCGPLRDVQPIVSYSRVIEMGAWAYGTIYGWRPEMDLFQSALPAAFAAIPVLYTIAESPLGSLLERLLERLFESLLESLLASLFERLLESLLESLFESLLESLLERASHREE